jgi:hypothetical protein
MAHNAAMRSTSLAGCCALVLAFAVPSVAAADESIIKNPGDHPPYKFEIEPHGLLGFGGPFQDGRGELGAGVRGTVIIVDNGFVKEINNSVGISFGADFFFPETTVFVPVAMQWNFWLSTHWSVFGEPGIGLAPNHYIHRDLLSPILMVGGRYHFNDKVALTMRIGYPAISVGVSFLL